MGRILDQASNTVDPLEGREFELTNDDFKFIQWFIHKNVGIFLSDKKKAMVYGRISRLLREHDLQRFSQYREIIEADDNEKINFINNITTNKTHFFREMHHFDYVTRVLVPRWQNKSGKKVRIWSAGCSTGEEPYSYMSLLATLGLLDNGMDIRLLASDLDTKVLAHARKGVYPEKSLESIPEQFLKSSFVKGKGVQSGNIKVKEKLQQHITFNQLNLLAEWPIKQKFDLISCRNVMIYFDKPTQETLIRRFYEHLTDDGVLFIGHSESVGNCTDIFRHIGHTIYFKQ
ncbi:CheR family methyltransferase [Vibrio tapetis]|uniref:Chemotaxis protein methyltransferase n=1 Tax=Vibrio tapetis subsp. tapetis TaxID=1671868 RepID=A0A2N8ZK20_9VIBR|nr:protein-glutamate O-methyltransferase CheR [Vibrio tapetis]SON52237.1 chemotaxis regulator, protein-glutamate methyltransferase [Vibrio tapetis subsp. tapetis]